MPFYVISVGRTEVACCQEDSFYDAEEGAVKILERPLSDLRIREVNEAEAEAWAQEWMEGKVEVDDICPICNGHRMRKLVGDLILRECKTCGFKS